MFTRSGHALILLAATTAAAGCMSTEDPDAAAKCLSPDNRSELVADVLTIVNQVRGDEGLSPLVVETTLNQVADDFACEMIENDFFSHESPKSKTLPGERLTQAGYIYYSMGENLAVGQPTAVEVVADWLQSPRHRDNILSPNWRETGISVRTDGDLGWFWVQEFADPLEFSRVSAE